jgi:hypothetical protein
VRIFIYGDVGGHFDPFMESLERIGVDTANWSVPPGMVVIQVGDLVHRGPKSEELVAWVDQALKVNRGDDHGRWVQLFGNHEGHHVGGPTFGENRGGVWHDFELAPEAETTLKRWFHSRQAFMAAAIRRTDTEESRDVLVTHAGLAWHTWVGIGEPATIEGVARALNAQKVELAFAPGWLLGGYRPAREGGVQPPGVAWASAAKEVYPSWEQRPCPFDQVHGHSTLWHWSKSQWFVDYSIGANIERDGARRFTKWTTESGARFYCVDQALGQYLAFDIEPLPMEGKLLWPV